MDGMPVAMDEGLRFAIREGGRTVGSGVVTKILVDNAGRRSRCASCQRSVRRSQRDRSARRPVRSRMIAELPSYRTPAAYRCVAQLVEQRSPKPQVSGSIPSAPARDRDAADAVDARPARSGLADASRARAGSAFTGRHAGADRKGRNGHRRRTEADRPLPRRPACSPRASLGAASSCSSASPLVGYVVPKLLGRDVSPSGSGRVRRCFFRVWRSVAAACGRASSLGGKLAGGQPAQGPSRRHLPRRRRPASPSFFLVRAVGLNFEPARSARSSPAWSRSACCVRRLPVPHRRHGHAAG